MRQVFKRIAADIRRRAIIKLLSGMGGRELLDRYILFDTIMGFIADCGITGDYLEFGCSSGKSMADAFGIANYYHLDKMRFFGFDSFQGLPLPAGLDADLFRRYEEGQFACDLGRYRRNLQRSGVDMQRVTLTPGWYSETLTENLKSNLCIHRAAVILVDCDLYESTVPVLKFITDFIQDGTVLIFDDWFSYKGRTDRGEARAFREWLEENPRVRATEYHRSGRTMISFIMQLDENDSQPAAEVREQRSACCETLAR